MIEQKILYFCRLIPRHCAFKTALLGFLSIFCAWTAPALEARAETVPSIVVGIAPLKYLVSSIAGQRAMVSVVLPGGGDPHTYEPSAIQMGIISDADAYFSIRQPFEEVLLPKLKDAAPKMMIVDISAKVERMPPPDVLEIKADPPPSPPPANATMMGGVTDLMDNATAPAPEEGHGSPTAEATAGEAHNDHDHDHEVDHDHGPNHSHDLDHDHDHNLPDPHIWLSPANMKIMAKAVLDELIVLMPAHGPEFTINYERFIADVTALDTAIREVLDPLPAGQRAFLSFHPSWGYFARDYNLTQIAVEVEGYEPSPQVFAKVIDAAKARHVRTILLEMQFSTSLVRTLAEELNANVVAISGLTVAWRDNLLTLAQVLATPPEIPEGFYDETDALNALKNAAAGGSSQ